MRIILYDQQIRAVSGLTTFERNFIQAFSEDHQIILMYKQSDPATLLTMMSKNVVFTQDIGQLVEGDICIYSSIQHGFPEPNIKAKKYVQMVHCDLAKWGVQYQKHEGIDQYVAVGENAQMSLMTNFLVDSIVIPDILSNSVKVNNIKFLTASRIFMGKGFERMVTLVEMFRKAGKLFTWEIYGEGSLHYVNELKDMLKPYPEVQFFGKHDHIQSFMQKADYVVQLSDDEGFCYSIYEALQIKKPVIITHWPHANEIIEDGKNGYILEMDLSNTDIDKIFNEVPQKPSLPEIAKRQNVIQEWENLFKTIQ